MVNNVMDKKQMHALPCTENLEDLATSFNNFFTEKIGKIRENMDSYACPNFSTSVL